MFRNDEGSLEDPIMKYTVYSSRAEMEAVESGRYFDDLEAKDEAKRQREKEALEGLLDVLGLTGGCRKCPYITETAEGFLNSSNSISVGQLDFLKACCAGCDGKGTGKIQPEHGERLTRWWNDIVEWVKLAGLKTYHCPWCAKVYEIYGRYKDPDDEWNAIDSPEGCSKCKYFGED